MNCIVLQILIVSPTRTANLTPLSMRSSGISGVLAGGTYCLPWMFITIVLEKMPGAKMRKRINVAIKRLGLRLGKHRLLFIVNNPLSQFVQDPTACDYFGESARNSVESWPPR